MARGTIVVPAPAYNLGIRPQLRDMFELMGKAFSGDMVWVCTPSVYSAVATAAAWTKDFYVELQTAAGEVHTWFNDVIASGVAISDDSSGTATIPSTTLTIVNGAATITVSGNTATWAAGERVTLTVAAATIMGYTVAAKTGILTFSIQSLSPSASPSASPSKSASASPSASPSLSPSKSPSASPSVSPSASPSLSTSASPSVSPSKSPSASPSVSPSASPSASPSLSPSVSPS